jgi:hypothetical protein
MDTDATIACKGVIMILLFGIYFSPKSFTSY